MIDSSEVLIGCILIFMSTCLYKRGFTLIELLVVIAIIGILASVVHCQSEYRTRQVT